MKKNIIIIIVLAFSLCYGDINAQLDPFLNYQMVGGSEIILIHRPDIGDTAYQVRFRINRPCHSCANNQYGFTSPNVLSFTDTCNYKYQNFNVTYFAGVNSNNKHAQLFINPYTGDSLQVPLYKQCAAGYPPIQLQPPGYQLIIAPIQDTFLLLRDYWYDTIIFLPEKCGKWQVVNYGVAYNGFVNFAVGGFAGYSIGTNVDTTDFFDYGITGWSYDQRGVTQINTLVPNSNPYFLSLPTGIYRKGVPAVYKQNPIDPDGDSLVFKSIDLVYYDTVWKWKPQSYWQPFIPHLKSGIPYYLGIDSVEGGLRKVPGGYACVPGTGPYPSCNRYDPVYNPFDTDSTFYLNPSTGDISFTAQSSPQFVHLLLQCDEYRNGTWVGAVYRRVNFFIFDSLYAPEPLLAVDTTNLQNCFMDSNYVFRTCPNQAISIPYTIKGTANVSFLKAKDNHSIAIPPSSIVYQNQNTDSIHGLLTWTTTQADTGWHYILITVSDSACAQSPYIQEYTYQFKIYVTNNWALYTQADTAICAGQPITLSTNGGGAMPLQWSIVSGTPNSLSCTLCNKPIATPAQTSTYAVEVANGMSCVSKDTITIKVHTDFTLNTTPDLLLCGKHDTTMLQTIVTGNNNPVSYSWTPVNAILGAPTSAQITVNPNLAQQFTVSVQDSAGCFTHQNVVNITYDSLFNPDISFSKTDICTGDTVHLVAGGGAGTTLWSPNYNIDDINSPSVYVWPDVTTTYFAQVNSLFSACSANVSHQVDVISLRADAGPDREIFDGESVELGGLNMLCGTGCNVKWFPDHFLFFDFYLKPKAVPHITTKYWVLLSSDGGGCIDRDSVLVTVKCTDIYMPNAFNPSGSGEYTRVFGPRNVGLDINYFRIFNRWGELVFESHDNKDRWDGKHNGKEQPMDTYVWVIDGKCPNGQAVRKSGNVMLVR